MAKWKPQLEMAKEERKLRKRMKKTLTKTRKGTRRRMQRKKVTKVCSAGLIAPSLLPSPGGPRRTGRGTQLLSDAGRRKHLIETEDSNGTFSLIINNLT